MSFLRAKDLKMRKKGWKVTFPINCHCLTSTFKSFMSASLYFPYFPSHCVSPSLCWYFPLFANSSLLPPWPHPFLSLWSSPSLQNLSDEGSLSNLPRALARPAPPHGPSVPAVPVALKKKQKNNHSQPTLMSNQQSHVTSSRFSLVSRVLLTSIKHTMLTFLFCEFKFLSFLWTNDKLAEPHTMTWTLEWHLKMAL